LLQGGFEGRKTAWRRLPARKAKALTKAKATRALGATCLNRNASACRGPPSGGLWLNVPLVHASVISTYLAKIASDPLLAFFERLVWRGTVSANGNEID
jgi:hypothetical protein